MKKLFLVALFAVSASAIAFNVTSDLMGRYKGLLPETYASEFTKNVSSEAVFLSMEEQFADEFDEIELINAHSSIELGIDYYTVYGLKDGNPAVEMIKMQPGDLESESFTAVQCTQGYCVKSPLQPSCVVDNFFGIKCGCIQGIPGGYQDCVEF